MAQLSSLQWKVANYMVFIGEPFKNSDLEEVQNENFSLGQVGDVSVRL